MGSIQLEQHLKDKLGIELEVTGGLVSARGE